MLNKTTFSFLFWVFLLLFSSLFFLVFKKATFSTNTDLCYITCAASIAAKGTLCPARLILRYWAKQLLQKINKKHTSSFSYDYFKSSSSIFKVWYHWKARSIFHEIMLKSHIFQNRHTLEFRLDGTKINGENNT